MNQPSFATAYRSAAILAAFSGADASRHEPAWEGAPGGVPPMATERRFNGALVRHLLSVARATILVRRARPSRSHETEALAAQRWRSPCASESSTLTETGRGAGLVSHFAFSDDADAGHRGTRP